MLVAAIDHPECTTRMSVFSVRSDDHDLSMEQAVEQAQRDYARLLHIHDVSWETDLAASVVFRCTCSPGVSRSSSAIEAHIKTEIRRARGPVRPPNPKAK